MHPRVIAVWKAKNPSDPKDEKLLDLSSGLLVPVSRKKNRPSWAEKREIFNGMEAWGEISDLSQRIKMKFEEASYDFVFPETFRADMAERKKARAASRVARKIEIDRLYRSAAPHYTIDSRERADVSPDEKIAPFPVRMTPVWPS